MVRDTLSGGGLPVCQIWKAYLERQKGYSSDTICYGRRDRFDLEVKIQGQRSPTMVRDTSSGGGLPTCQIWKACLERQKSYSPDTICYGRTDGRTDHYRASGTKWRGPNNSLTLSTCVVTSMRVNILFQCVTKRVAVHWEFFNYTRGRIIWIYMQFSRNMTEDPLEYHIEK